MPADGTASKTKGKSYMSIINYPSENSNTLINITYGDKPTVSARELWEFLDRPYDQFTKWFDKYKEYGFTEDLDYRVLSTKILTSLGAAHDAVDYEITVGMAKELSMLQKTEKGKQARLYFISVEEAAQNPKPMTPLEIMRGMLDSQIQQEQRIASLENTVAELEARIDTEEIPTHDWQSRMLEEINRIITVRKLNRSLYLGQLYKRLECETGCNLESRKTRLIQRLKKEGVPYRERMAVTKLQVISNDISLKMIFESIVSSESTRCA
jgi:phage anti-repressor protein